MSLEPLGSGWEPLLVRALDGLGPETTRLSLSGKTPSGWLAALSLYLDELVTWNRRTDLTAARSAEELVDLTLADAAVIAQASTDGGEWTDVGSGAGAPGLVLSLLLPGARVLLVEPRERRVAFLRSVIGRLRLDGARVHRGRSDTLGVASCDTAVSRATLPPAEWLAEGSRLARTAVWVLLAREQSPELSGWEPDVERQYAWPLTHVPRRAVRYVKAAIP